MAYYDSRSHMLDRLEAAYSDLEDSIDEHKEALARIDALESLLDKMRDILGDAEEKGAYILPVSLVLKMINHEV